MPATLVQSFAAKAGVPVARVEKLWGQAKVAVRKQYGLDEPAAGSDSTKYYRLVVGVLKRMLKIKESSPAVDPSLVNQLRQAGMASVAELLECEE